MLSQLRKVKETKRLSSGVAMKWHYKPRYRQESAPMLAAMLAMGIILLLSWAVLTTYDWIHSPNVLDVDPESTLFWGPYEINAYLFRIAPFYDSRGQRLAHQFALIATVLLALFSRPFSSLVPLLAKP